MEMPKRVFVRIRSWWTTTTPGKQENLGAVRMTGKPAFCENAAGVKGVSFAKKPTNGKLKSSSVAKNTNKIAKNSNTWWPLAVWPSTAHKPMRSIGLTGIACQRVLC